LFFFLLGKHIVRDVNLNTVKQRIQLAAGSCKRSAEEILLLAVSKGHQSASIRELYNQGVTAFGENYLQELLEKQKALSSLTIQWHFIGPVQSKKAKDICNICEWVHSVDRIKIAGLLSSHRMECQNDLNVLIQVNIDEEPSKSGIYPSELIDFAREIQTLPKLKLRGLMCIPSPRENRADQRKPFHQLHQLLHNINTTLHLTLDTLSMGMSTDLEAAIFEGSTIVRIGRALFGERR
jgi:PLP dependent protein